VAHAKTSVRGKKVVSTTAFYHREVFVLPTVHE